MCASCRSAQSFRSHQQPRYISQSFTFGMFPQRFLLKDVLETSSHCSSVGLRTDRQAGSFSPAFPAPSPESRELAAGPSVAAAGAVPTSASPRLSSLTQ